MCELAGPLFYLADVNFNYVYPFLGYIYERGMIADPLTISGTYLSEVGAIYFYHLAFTN